MTTSLFSTKNAVVVVVWRIKKKCRCLVLKEEYGKIKLYIISLARIFPNPFPSIKFPSPILGEVEYYLITFISIDVWTDLVNELQGQQA